tara:strand:- start:26768 stop:28111 length:1344 start_codon:yes stop_codon:yes gene_type:complete
MTKQRKLIFLDTNVLISDPDSIGTFMGDEGENLVSISGAVFEELDRLKRRPGYVGHQARAAIKSISKNLDDIHLQGWGDARCSPCYDGVNMDDVIVDDFFEATSCLSQRFDSFVLVSQDEALRTKVRARKSSISMNIVVEEFRDEPVAKIDHYMCMPDIEPPTSLIEVMMSNSCHIDDIDFHLDEESMEFVKSMSLNTYYKVGKVDGFFVLKGDASGAATLTCRSVDMPETYLTSGKVKPRNLEQLAVLDALQDHSIKCVSITGRQGTGKTFLAISEALNMMDSSQIVLTRAMVTNRDHEMGFLPGGLNDKIDPWMAPFKDAIEIIMPKPNKGVQTSTFDILRGQGKIELQSIAYVKGRSFIDSVMIIDESQDLSREDVKKLITRIGEGSRVILLGDLGQIDRERLSTETSGLSYLIDRFSGSPLFAHIHLKSVQRSGLAALAVEKL